MRTWLCLLLLFTSPVFAQDYSYVHYDAANGLPSKRVYAMCQDNNGFMWFATDNGVCRFDGQHFKLFTTDDGLPDNDIINIFCDANNRIWLLPYKKDIAYYYKGKIHNRQNDTLLQKLPLGGFPQYVFSDPLGRTWIETESNLCYITPNQEVRDYKSELGLPPTTYIFHSFADNKGTLHSFMWQGYSPVKYNMLCSYSQKGLIIEKVFEKAFAGNFNHYAYAHNLLIYPGNPNDAEFHILPLGAPDEQKHIIRLKNLISFNILNDSLIIFNTGAGADLYNYHQDKIIRSFLLNKTVNRSFRDDEGNLWFCTLDEGLYKLNQNAVHQLTFNKQTTGNSEVYAINGFHNKVIAGLNQSIFAAIDEHNTITYHSIASVKDFNRVLEMIPLNENRLLIRADKNLAYADASLNILNNYESPIKCLSVDGDMIYASSTSDIRAWKNTNFDNPSILFNNKGISIFVKHDSIYVGGMDGLTLILPDRSVHLLGEKFPALKGKTTAIREGADGTRWIITYANGIVALKNNQQVAHLTVKNGLTSNNCRSVFLTDSVIWVGTEKGLNKIQLTKPGYPITRFTTTDGLPDNVINAIYLKDSLIYIGTPAGLAWFNEQKINSQSRCRVIIEQIMADTSLLQPDLPSYNLSYRQRNISFTFNAVSLKAAGDIVYSYRLLGLDDNWQQTTSNNANFISLPPGSYTFEVFATNKAGLNSPVINIPFFIETPFWRTDWFRVLAVLFSALLIWLLFRWRIRLFQKKANEKNRTQQQIFELEQKAKKAQMNPHFIFNCISAIQNFVFTGDVEASNRYISGFAQLIRQTLDNSDKPVVALSEEIKYLQNYLSLEQMRFSGKFSFTVETDPAIHPDYIYLPPMLLQPYIENSIRHGIAYRRDYKGNISVRFDKTETHLVCVIGDNGIGRRRAEELKGSMHIEFQSKGMSLTRDRIEAIGRFFGEQIELEISDIFNEQKEVAGTRVQLKFPLDLLEKIS